MQQLHQHLFFHFLQQLRILIHHEAGLAFRNIVITIASQVAFDGLKFEAAEGKWKKDVDEAVAFTAKRFTKTREITDDLFEKIDANGDGFITIDEFLAVFPNVVPKDKLSALFAQVDVNGDGKLDKDEAFHLYGLIVLGLNEQTDAAVGSVVHGIHQIVAAAKENAQAAATTGASSGASAQQDAQAAASTGVSAQASLQSSGSVSAVQVHNKRTMDQLHAQAVQQDIDRKKMIADIKARLGKK